MKNLPAALILEKNRLSTPNAWLMTLDVAFTGYSPLYLVNNTEDITFLSRTYTAFPFKLDLVSDGENGEIPQIKLYVSNVTRALQGYIEALEGGVDSDVTLRWINAGHLSEDYAALTLTFSILECTADADWCTFTLGGPNLLRSNYPQFLYLAEHCNWVRYFKGAECAYTGAATTCDGRLDTCRSYGNSRRFGGQPGLSGGGIRLA